MANAGAGGALRTATLTVLISLMSAVSAGAASGSQHVPEASRSQAGSASSVSSYARQVAVGRKTTRIGRWQIPSDFLDRPSRTTMGSAERALGQGRERSAFRSADGGRLVDDAFSCTLLYPSSGLTIGFSTLGSQSEGQAGCDNPNGIFVGKAHVYGGRWETSRGLGVGDSVRTLRRLYPAAESHRLSTDTPGAGRSWWLKRKRLECCDQQLVPTLEAVVADGRVNRVIVNVGAQGE